MTLLHKFKRLSIWNQLGVIGSVASIIALLYAYFVPVGSNTVNNTKTQNSGIIVEGNVSGGNVAGRDIINNQYGVPQKVVDRLEELLKEKDIKLQEREAVIASWMRKYKDLESQLASRTDDTAKQAKALLSEGKLEEAEKLFLQALDNELNKAKKATTQAAANAYSLAKIKALQLNYPAAEAYYKKAIQLDPDNAIYLNDLGVHLRILGKYPEAESVIQRSLAIREKVLGPDHPEIATSLNNLATLYYYEGKYSEAEPLVLGSLAILEKNLGQDHPNVGRSLGNLAELYTIEGKYREAEAIHQRSLKIIEKHLGQNHPDVAISLNNLALLYFFEGKYSEAVPLYQRSLSIFENLLGKVNPNTKLVSNNLQQLQAHLNGQFQVQIKAVLPNSQAEQIGLKPNDILLCYDNQPILGITAFIYGRSLEPATNSAKELKVLRNGQELVFNIKPGKIGAELQEQGQ